MEPIEISDITDVSIFIHAKGEKWLVMARTGVDKEEAKQMRIAIITMLISTEAGLNVILNHPYNQELIDKLKAKQNNETT